MLSLNQIERAIMQMDDTYDANFGEWIRNEDNSRIVAYNMKKYIDSYKISDIIIVIKWIVRDWTLKSIIIFTKKMLMEDIKMLSFKESDRDVEKYYNRIKIVSGLIYTWNPIFISEFILATIKYFTVDEKIKMLRILLDSFDVKKLSDIIVQLNGKLDNKVRNDIVKCFRLDNNEEKRRRTKRTKSIIEAYNIS